MAFLYLNTKGRLFKSEKPHSVAPLTLLSSTTSSHFNKIAPSVHFHSSPFFLCCSILHHLAKIDNICPQRLICSSTKH